MLMSTLDLDGWQVGACMWCINEHIGLGAVAGSRTSPLMLGLHHMGVALAP
jgi:hypothetical protein